MAVATGITNNKGCKARLERIQCGCAHTSRRRQASDKQRIDGRGREDVRKRSSKKGRGKLLRDDAFAIQGLKRRRKCAVGRTFHKNTERRNFRVKLICPLLGGPKSMLFWTRKEKTNAIQETHAEGDYRQAA